MTNLGRKDTDGSAEHSVYQRASFVYVSMRMCRDAPLFGCGFGRYYDLKMPYLSDRSQQLELESLRNLDHHNTLLSIMVETGHRRHHALRRTAGGMDVLGMATLPQPRNCRPWERSQGLFHLAVLINYMSSALFHDLTLLPTEHWPLFLTAGVSATLLSRRADRTRTEHAIASNHWFPTPSRACTS